MGTEKVTIKDIAAEAKVSVSLVSFVMNNIANGRNIYRVNKDTAQRILEVAKRLNYSPNNAARSLRSGKSYSIGVIVSDISNKFFADIARCIEDRAYKYNYTVFFGSTDENPEKLSHLIEVFVNKGMDGLIIVPCDGAYEAIRRVEKSGIPVVLLDRDVPEQDMTGVLLNNRKAGMQVTSALLNNGCKKVEMVSYSMRLSNIRDREDGFMEAMRNAGQNVDDSMIHRIPYGEMDKMASVISGAYSRGVDGLLFATNTLVQTGLREICSKGLRVPEDFRIAAFDTNDAFELDMMDIIYIQQPASQFGTEVVDLMMKAIDDKVKKDNEGLQTRIILNPRLVEKHPRHPR